MLTATKDDKRLSHCLVADGTASIHLSLWDNQGESLQPGDILHLSGGCVSLSHSLSHSLTVSLCHSPLSLWGNSFLCLSSVSKLLCRCCVPSSCVAHLMSLLLVFLSIYVLLLLIVSSFFFSDIAHFIRIHSSCTLDAMALLNELESMSLFFSLYVVHCIDVDLNKVYDGIFWDTQHEFIAMGTGPS